jgi:nicotinamidase/pyrazinamidase
VTTYDERTALVVVDVQNDFADPSGSLYVHGGELIVEFVNREIHDARTAGAFVAYTQDWHPPSTPHFVTGGGLWPPHCVQDTWGAEFHPALDVSGPDVRARVVRKGDDGGDGYSGFSVIDPLSGQIHATALDGLLRQQDAQGLVVCGLATDYCVVETVVDAMMLGYTVHVPTAGIRAVNLDPGDGDRAIVRMRDAGADVV